MKLPIMLLLIIFISSCVRASDSSVEDIFISPYQLLTDGELFHRKQVITSGYICIFSLNSFLFPTKVDCDNFLQSSGILIDLPYSVYSKKEKFGDRGFVKAYGSFFYNVPASPELSFGRILKARIEPITIEEVFLDKYQSNKLTQFTESFLKSVCFGNKEQTINMTSLHEEDKKNSRLDWILFSSDNSLSKRDCTKSVVIKNYTYKQTASEKNKFLSCVNLDKVSKLSDAIKPLERTNDSFCLYIDQIKGSFLVNPVPWIFE